MTPFRIAVASGKGGTGKTTVSVNLSHFISKHYTGRVLLVDCDVEEPNDALFFADAVISSSQVVMQQIPRIDPSLCTYCRKCAEYCEYNAIVVIPPVHFAEVNRSLCHSCGACLVACEYGAITEFPEPVGMIRTYATEQGNVLTEGVLDIGSAKQTAMIKAVKGSLTDESGVIILDAPPGTSCPVVETVADADYVLLVTEPTPFGLYDLKLTVQLLRSMGKPFGVIVNKSGLGNSAVFEYLVAEKIDLVGEIPFEKAYASLYATGSLLQEIPASVEARYRKIVDYLIPKIKEHEGNHSA